MAVSDDVRPVAPAEYDRMPPQDVAAEQSVLGGMLLSKDAIADVIEILRPNDFYKPAHATVFDAVLDLYGRGEPADPVTVAAALADSGSLARVGGASYLHTLISLVPTAANAGYYARIVAERAVLRRLIEAGTRIVQLGHGAAGGQGRDVDDVVDMAQQAVYEVTEKRTSEDYTVLEELLQPTMDEIEAIGAHGGVMSGVPTGFVDLDRLTNGLHPGQLIVVAARPGLGKSTFALDVTRSASIRHNLTSAIFSLEMSKIEITMRLLSAEAKVPLHHLRSGQLSEDDWTKLARRMGEVSEAPLFIDDSPNMTMMEIRAKARRLKQRHDLRLIVLDYLQLMSSPKRVESRQQEVSELSRGLKLLAKELEVPVIAVSQLNRGPEQRTDKRPQLSDLRESGCLPASTRLIRADNGCEVTLGELMARNEQDLPVWSLDDGLRYVARRMTRVFASGVKEVFRVCLASGKEVHATANHPLLTFDGWRALDALAVGSRIAVPRHLPDPLSPAKLPDAEVILIAHHLGASSFVRDQLQGKGSPMAAWLGGLGLFGLRSHERFIPAPIFGLPRSQAALFLRHLWSTAGCVRWDERQRSARIHYASTSRRLLDDVARLLLRFGINSGIKSTRKADHRSGYRLHISGGEDQRRFLRWIGAGGAHRQQVIRCQRELDARLANPSLDTVPREVWHRVRDRIATTGMAHRGLSAGRGGKASVSTVAKSSPSRARLGQIAAVLGDEELEMLATNDVFWDEIVEITSVGEQEVFDATVLMTHNFIADGVAVHNSIEQDADAVILLHREDYYEKESPRAGEADFIVAKHRNGPTDTITVAFQGHFSRFVDMSTGM